MVGRSIEISRETCQHQSVDSPIVKFREPNPERAKAPFGGFNPPAAVRKVDMKRTDNTKRGEREPGSRQRSSQEQLPVRVPFAARPLAITEDRPAGETPAIAGWAQRAVWTDRMLTTLLNDTV